MRARVGILAMVLGLAVVSCTDEPSDPAGPSASPEASPQAGASDPPLTEITVPCPRFEETAKKITDAQAALYAGTGAAIDDLVAELNGLKEGAPPDIQAALTDMVAAFRDAAELLANPTRDNMAELAELAPKLATDGQKITAFFTSQCD